LVPSEEGQKLKAFFQPPHQIHPLMQTGDNEKPVIFQPDDVMVFAAVDADTFRRVKYPMETG
jgi:hypothetical protein